jgi:hypothetical protein
MCEAAGILVLLQAFRPLLILDHMTITGRATLDEEMDVYRPDFPPTTVRPMAPNPLTPLLSNASLVVWKGDLVPQGYTLSASAMLPTLGNSNQLSNIVTGMVECYTPSCKGCQIGINRGQSVSLLFFHNFFHTIHASVLMVVHRSPMNSTPGYTPACIMSSCMAVSGPETR